MLSVLFHVISERGHAGAATWHSAGHWLVFLAVVLPAWGAAAHAVATLLEYERIATRSRRMAQALTRIARNAESATEPQSLCAAVREAAQVIGIENHEWWVLLSFRELVLL